MSMVHSNPDPQPRYSYTPLSSKCSIRLLQILQETSNGIPQCKLTTISLDDKPSFVALSYTWGSPVYRIGQETGIADKRRSIICDGCFLYVHQNLFDFLKRVRPGGPEECLSPEDRIWIDAICINQDSLDERNAQVRLMAEIYKAARAVLVWLGKEENDDTQNSVELLRRISATPKEKLNELKKLQIHHPVFLEAFGQCGGSTDRWLSLKQLLSRSWFSRVWIIQEIAFASSIIVLCGNLSFPWEDCVEACEFLSYSVVNDLQTPSEIPFTGANADILSQFQQLKSADLLNVLLYTRPFEASNPRDKIFAVLGLATLGPTKVPAAEIIRIEYGLTPTEVFLEATWAIIRHSNNLKIVAEVEDSRLRNIPDLPTWVPDFSSVNRPSIYHQSQPLNADGGLKPSLTSHSNPRWLGTTAYRLGKVVSSEGLGIKQHFIESLSNVLAFIFELSPKYITGEGKLEALWRTMIQNGWEWTSPAAAGTAHHFRDWILMHIAHAAQQCAGRATTQKDFDRVATQECIDRTVTHLETYSKTDPTDIMPHHIKDAIKAIQDTFDTNSYELIESGSKYGHEFKYYRHMRIFRTNTGLLGLGQPSLQTDNSLWIIPGISVPMTLQHVIGTEDRFRVVGPAYVHGVMNGEALKWDQLDRQSIILE